MALKHMLKDMAFVKHMVKGMAFVEHLLEGMAGTPAYKNEDALIEVHIARRANKYVAQSALQRRRCSCWHGFVFCNHEVCCQPLIACLDVRGLPTCRNIDYNNLSGPVPKEWSAMTQLSHL
jgi:uncharacterized circularly permuted ATP-grasp superfamily protein